MAENEMAENRPTIQAEEPTEELSQKYIDSLNKEARRLMSHALQHFGAGPIKGGIGAFMLNSAYLHSDLITAAIGGAIVVWGCSDLGKGIHQIKSGREIGTQVTTLREALTRRLIER